MSAEALYMSLAIGLTVLGSIGNALGYVWQKKGHLSHIETNEVREIQDEETESLLKNRTWVIGFVVCLFGSILTAAAFKFGAQSVLAPLSALVLVCNAIFANKILGEPFTRQNLYGIVLVIIGSVIAVIFGPKSSTAPITLSYIETCWRNHIFLIFFITLTLLVAIDYVFVKLIEKKNAKTIELTHTIVYHSNFMMISYIGLAAYFGSVNILFMKSLMIIIGSFRISYFKNYLFYLTVIGIVAVNVLLEMFRQTAIKFFDASYVVPIFQVMLILGAALMGAIFFGEFALLSAMELTLFIVGIFITVLGVAVLAFHVGAVYMKMLSKLDETIGTTLTMSHKKQALSLRARARKNFAKKTHREATLYFPAFYGTAAAVNYAREFQMRSRGNVLANEKHSTKRQLDEIIEQKETDETQLQDKYIKPLDEIVMGPLELCVKEKPKSKNVVMATMERINSKSPTIDACNSADIDVVCDLDADADPDKHREDGDENENQSLTGTKSNDVYNYADYAD